MIIKEVEDGGKFFKKGKSKDLILNFGMV